MIKKAYSLFLVAFALAASLLLVACGGGEDSGSAPPTVTITSALDTNQTDVLFTFTFSQDVGSTFTAEDVTVTGGTPGTFTPAGNGISFTMLVTPSASVVTATVPPGKFSAVARNSNVAQASQSFIRTPAINFSETGLVAYGYEGIASATVVTDPTGGTNKVLKLVKGPASNPWGLSNLQVFGTEGAPTVPVMDFSSSKKISIRSYTDADVGTKITIKLAGTRGGAMAAEAATTKKNDWEILTFDFTNPTSGTFSSTEEFNRVTIIPSWTETGGQASPSLAADKNFYIDDITYATLGAPIKAASTPTVNTAAVKSLISSNTNYAATSATFSNVCCGTQATNFSLNSRNIKKYAGLTFSLIDLASVLNVTDYSYVSVDVWSSKSTTFKLKIVDYGADGVNKYSGNNLAQDDTESELAAPFTVGGGWQTVKIDLGDFTGLSSKTKIGQIVLSATGAPDVYIDNLFFGKLLAPISAPSTPAQASGNVISIYSDASGYSATQPTGLNLNPDWGQSGRDSQANLAIGGNNVRKLENLNYQGFSWDANPIDISSYSKLHIDLWTADLTSLDVVIIGSVDSSAYTITLTKGQWNSIDIPLASFSGTDKTILHQIKIVATPFGGGTVFMDNLYFWK